MLCAIRYNFALLGLVSNDEGCQKRMQLIRGLKQSVRPNTGCVATIGKFDGVHCGHQQIIEAVIAKAQAMNFPSLVMVFEPDPYEYFQAEKAPARLTRFREKFRLIEQLGVDWLACLSFDKRLANMPAEDFIQSILVKQLNVKHLIVGDDFRFGASRQGDYSMLERQGKSHFTVQNTQSIKQGTERISSSLIRQKLQQDELDHVRLLLGRNYSICGKVSHGQKLGRQLGFPTINIPLKRRVSPIHGVYLVLVGGVADEPVYGVANVGKRPTVNGERAILEVHLLNFNGDCYGAHVEVWFLDKIREERKFDSLEHLKQQISKDIAAANKKIQH